MGRHVAAAATHQLPQCTIQRRKLGGVETVTQAGDFNAGNPQWLCARRNQLGTQFAGVLPWRCTK
jgi:hypothetical protein